MAVKADLGLHGVDHAGGDGISVHGHGGDVHIGLHHAGGALWCIAGGHGIAGHQPQLISGLSAQRLGAVHRLRDGVLEAADGDGDAGGQVRLCGLGGLIHGNAQHLIGRLAHYIVRQSLGLLVPLFSDAADAAHAVISAQFIFAGHRDGEIREELALAVKICLCLYGVDHAVSDDARLIHGDGDDRHIRLDQTVLLSHTGAGG